MLKRNYHSNRGFTLVEIMVASVFLGVAVIALVKAFTGISSSILVSGNLSIAAHLAQEKADAIKSMPFDEIPLRQGSVWWYYGNIFPFPDETIEVNKRTFVRKIDVLSAYIDKATGRVVPTDLTRAGNIHFGGSAHLSKTEIKLVTVTIEWRELGRAKSHVKTVLINNPEQEVVSITLQGLVTSTNSVPIANVTVFSPQNVGSALVTDANGRFTMTFSPGEVTLTASDRSPYLSTTTIVKLDRSNPTPNVTLRMLNIDQMFGTVSMDYWVNRWPLISRFAGDTGAVAPCAAGSEYIEIFNPTAYPWTIGQGTGDNDLTLQYTTNLVSYSTVLLTFPTGQTTVPPKGYYLIANQASVCSQPADAVYNPAVDLVPVSVGTAGGLRLTWRKNWGVTTPVDRPTDFVYWNPTQVAGTYAPNWIQIPNSGIPAEAHYYRRGSTNTHASAFADFNQQGGNVGPALDFELSTTSWRLDAGMSLPLRNTSQAVSRVLAGAHIGYTGNGMGAFTGYVIATNRTPPLGVGGTNAHADLKVPLGLNKDVIVSAVVDQFQTGPAYENYYHHTKRWLQDMPTPTVISTTVFFDDRVNECYANLTMRGEFKGTRLSNIPVDLALSTNTADRTPSQMTDELGRVFLQLKPSWNIDPRPTFVTRNNPVDDPNFNSDYFGTNWAWDWYSYSPRTYIPGMVYNLGGILFSKVVFYGWVTTDGNLPNVNYGGNYAGSTPTGYTGPVNGVPNVKLLLTNHGRQQTFSTIATDRDGRFILQVATGTYQVEIVPMDGVTVSPTSAIWDVDSAGVFRRGGPSGPVLNHTDRVFHLTSGMGEVWGNVTYNGSTIDTPAVVMITTGPIAGTAPPPLTPSRRNAEFSSARQTLTNPNGTYILETTAGSYHLYAWIKDPNGSGWLFKDEGMITIIVGGYKSRYSSQAPAQKNVAFP